MNAILTIGNKEQVPLIKGLNKSLIENARGFRLTVITDGLDKKSRKILRDADIRIWDIPEHKAANYDVLRGKNAQPLGKLFKFQYVADFLSIHREVENFIFLDPDIICQREPADIFHLVQGPVPLLSSLGEIGTTARMMNLVKEGIFEEEVIKRRNDEICTGAFGAISKDFLIWSENFLTYIKKHLAGTKQHAFTQCHDQDFFNLLILESGDDLFKEISTEYFYHALVFRKDTMPLVQGRMFLTPKGKLAPYFVHFSGNCWRRFPSLIKYFGLSTYIKSNYSFFKYKASKALNKSST